MTDSTERQFYRARLPEFADTDDDPLGRSSTPRAGFERGDCLRCDPARRDGESDADYKKRCDGAYDARQRDRESAATVGGPVFTASQMQGTPILPDSERLFDANRLRAAAWTGPLPRMIVQVEASVARSEYHMRGVCLPGIMVRQDEGPLPSVIAIDISEGLGNSDPAIFAHIALCPVDANNRPCTYNQNVFNAFNLIVNDAVILEHGGDHAHYFSVLKDMFYRWKPTCGAVIEESHASEFIRYVRMQGAGLVLNGVPHGNLPKYERARVVEPYARMGRLQIRMDAPHAGAPAFGERFLSDFARFDGQKSTRGDEAVDVTGYALVTLAGNYDPRTRQPVHVDYHDADAVRNVFVRTMKRMRGQDAA
jgi:hypothetical protein